MGKSRNFLNIKAKRAFKSNASYLFLSENVVTRENAKYSYETAL